MLFRSKKFNTQTWSKEEPYLNKKYLDVVYWIISNYNGIEQPHITKIITRKNSKFWLKKMKENPSIISKMLQLDKKIKHSYKYQKTILDINTENYKYIKDILNEKIKKEYKHLIDSDKYNI